MSDRHNPDTPDDLAWSAERRLRFIEKQLYWEGSLNRRDLKHVFRISDQQASSDIAEYQKRAPENLAYDRVAKTYLPSEEFDPIFEAPDPNRDLLRTGVACVESLPFPKRSVDTDVVRDVYQAIQRGLALQIRYQSLSRPTSTLRWITPHALAFDSHRWHTRAFCHTHGDFRDFVLRRVTSIRSKEEHSLDSSIDLAWAKRIEMVIRTHPDLPEDQRKAVELDYNMRRGSLRISVRVALARYLTRWMRLDFESTKARPEQIQIVLANHDEVEATWKRLNTESAKRVKSLGVSRFGRDLDSST